MIGSLAIGAIIGLILVFLLILIIDDREGLNNAMNKDVNASKIAISIACTFASLLITAILQFALHEVGHLLFGVASGYKFSSIRIYKYAIVKDDSGFHVKKFNIQGTGGQLS